MNHDQFVSWLALEGFELKVHSKIGLDAWRIVPIQYPKHKAKRDAHNGYDVPIIKLMSGRWVFTEDAAPRHYVFSEKKLSHENIEAFDIKMLEKLRYDS